MNDCNTALPANADGEKDPTRSPAEITAMFDQIAPRYDLLNRMLSFGRDVAWRRAMASHLPPGADLRILDLATGTADQLLFLCASSDSITSGVGMDMAERMLDIGRDKIADRGLDDTLRLETGDATRIPAEDDAFDVATISFGIRNVESVQAALQEMRRVLRPGGRALILEFSIPRNRIVRAGHLLYLRYVLPLIGGIVSGKYRAYRYLNKTIETFPSGEAFCRELRAAGFTDVHASPLTFGVASIYQGDKLTSDGSDRGAS